MNNDELKMIEELEEFLNRQFSYARKVYPNPYEIDEVDVEADDIARALYRANYRRVDDDEIIIKKSKIDTMIWTVDELAKKLTHSQHETAKEILQIVDGKLDLYRNGVIGGTLYDDGYRNAVNEIKHTIKKLYEIEIEDYHEQKRND